MRTSGPEEPPDWLHLSDDEAIVWQRRPHPVALWPGAAIGAGIALAGLALIWLATTNGVPLGSWLGLAITLVGAVIVGIRYAFWTNTRYVITTAELYEKRGVVSRDVTQFRLDRIQNTTLEQSVAGRLLGYADLTVYTAGSGDPELTFSQVPAPGAASAALTDQLGDVVGTNRSASP